MKLVDYGTVQRTCRNDDWNEGLRRVIATAVRAKTVARARTAPGAAIAKTASARFVPRAQKPPLKEHLNNEW